MVLANELATAEGFDFFKLEDKLNAQQRDVRDKVRRFVENEVRPKINPYWDKAEFPRDIAMKLLDLKSKNNSKSVALPRQVAMYLCKTLTTASLPEIGKSFGGKHHSTVIHSIRKVEELRQKDSSFNSLVNTFVESFR